MSDHRAFVLSSDWEGLFSDRVILDRIESLERATKKTTPLPGESQIQYTHRQGKIEGQLEVYEFLRDRFPQILRGPLPAGTVLRDQRGEDASNRELPLGQRRPF